MAREQGLQIHRFHTLNFDSEEYDGFDPASPRSLAVSALVREIRMLSPKDRLGLFEDAWQRDTPPAMDDFAPAPADADRLEQLVGLVHIDLEYRWAPLTRTFSAERFRLEHYLEKFPELTAELPDLIAAEYRARKWAGETPTVAEYADRFAQSPEELAVLLAEQDAELTPADPPEETTVDPSAPLLAEFLTALATAGIAAPGEFSASTSRELARRLVDLGRMTRFQADYLLRGRGADLVLGPYLLLDRLGEGSSGRVYKAKERAKGELVALKVLREDVLGELDEAGLSRFRQEVEVAGRLEHPNVVRSRGAGSAGGIHFLAMEYLTGSDLGRLVTANGPLPAGLACEYVRQAALGLQHLADRGLVHRDVKPPNLFATDDGVVKLLDVGLARLQPLDAGRPGTSLTRTGDFLGTPDYMAPEQAVDPHAADIRADLYGLGCTWFFLLTGRPPFVGGTFVQKIDRHRAEDPPPIAKFRPDVGPEAAAVLHRLLAKNPAERFASPAELANALAELQARGLAGDCTGSAVLAVPREAATSQKSPRFRGRRALLAAGMVAPVAAYFTWKIRGEPTEDPSPSVDPSQVAEDALRLLEARERDPASDRDQLAIDVRAFRRKYPGTDPSERAAALLMRLPSPLDKLPVGSIPTAEALAGGRDDLPTSPVGLVAVLGKPGPKHWSAVTALAYHPGTGLLASGGFDCSVRLWDAESGAAKRTLLGHATSIDELSFSIDGHVLASASMDGIRLWDVKTGECRRVIAPKGGGRTVTVAFAPDGKTLASGGSYPHFALKVWDADTGEELHDIRGHTGLVESLAFRPDGTALVSSGVDGIIRTWDTKTWTEQHTFASRSLTVRSVAVRADGAIAVGGDAAVEVWDREGKSRLWTAPQTSQVRNVTFSPDGRTLAFGLNRDPTIQLCDADTGKHRRTLRGHADIVTGIAFTPDGGTLFSSNRDGSVKWWDTHTLRERNDCPKQRADVDMVDFRDDGEILTSGGKDGTVRFWETRRAAELRSVLNLPGLTRSVAATRDGQTLATGGWDGRIKVWEVATGRRLLDFPAHAGWVVRLALSPDGKTLASTGIEETACVKLWDTASGQPLRSLAVPGPNPPQMLRDVLFAGDGRRVAAVTPRATVHLWDAATGRELHSLTGRRGDNLCAFAMRPSGRLGAFGAADGTVTLWDTTTGETGKTFVAHAGAVLAAAFRPDGEVLATAGSDGLVRVWLPKEGEKRFESRVGPNHGRIHQITFSPDGRHLATANGNGLVYILRLPG